MRIKIQDDQKDCGLSVVQSLHYEYFNELISINELKKQSSITKQGLNVSSLIKLGSKYGIQMEGYQAPIDSLYEDNGYLIGIVDRNGSAHYIIFKYKKNKFIVFDPAEGKSIYTMKEFKEIYSGFIVTFSKKEYIKLENVDYSSPWIYIFKNKSLLIWILILIVIGIILSFISTLFSKIVFDKIIPNGLNKTLLVISLGFGFVALLRSFNDFIKHLINKKLNNIIEIDLTTKYINKIMEAKIYDIQKIEKSDHIRRLTLIPSVSIFLSTAIQIVFNEFIVLTIAISLLIWLSPHLFAFALFASGILAFTTLTFGIMIRPKYKELIKKHEKEFRLKNEYVNAELNLKNSNEYKRLYDNWESSYLSFKKSDYSAWSMSNWQGAINLFISLIAPIVLTYLSIHLIFDSQLTIGSMMMFMGIFHFFIDPTISLCDFILKTKQNMLNIQLINGVLNIDNEKLNKTGYSKDVIKSIALENVSVSLGKPIINIENLLINENINLYGANGTGKSFLLKIISGKYPYEGNILYNNLDLEYWSKEYIRDRFLLISPEDFVTNGTVYEYITLKNLQYKNNFSKFDQEHNISRFLNKNGIDANNMILNNGHNFSSGQRQIIKLMRIFSHNFDVLILDEAFENMSIKNFNWFKKILNNSNKMFIEVSHSKKYIKNSKEENIEILNKNIL